MILKSKKTAEDAADLRAEVNKIRAKIKKAFAEANDEAQELLYEAVHGEYDTFSGDAERYIRNFINAIVQNPMYR